MPSPQEAPLPLRAGTVGEVFLVFLQLGLTSFGGPIAHLGYFRDAFVLRRRWLDEKAYAELVALAQFLPGPASSQVGFALGLVRAGPFGALAAWVGFTLPSAALLFGFALSANAFGGPLAQAALHGLKLVAVAIVAQAVLGMARSLCPDRERASLAVAAVAIVVLAPGSLGQIAAIGIGAAIGIVLCREVGPGDEADLPSPISRRSGLLALVVFGGLLVLLPALADEPGRLGAIADAFYRTGSLVFGGGHVVLPLLEAETVAKGWLTADVFLAGYGAAQAVPGPLFTFAAYLGAVLAPGGSPLAGGLTALVAIFLPGLLLMLAALPYWATLRRRPFARAAMAGANAAVVGVLGAALYDPVFTSAVHDGADFVVALTGLLLLVAWKAPPWSVVLSGCVAGVILR